MIFKVFASRAAVALAVLGVVSTMAPSALAAPAPEGFGPVISLSGPDRVGTAVAVSRWSQEHRCADREDGCDFGSVAVLARADAYADALVAAPLARSLQAPVLLAAMDALPEGTRDELVRLDSREVVLMGGVAALSSDIEQELRGMGLRVSRVAGDDRFATAAVGAALLREREPAARERAFLAHGIGASPSQGWPDALAAAAWGARLQAPVLLTDTDTLPASTQDALAAAPEAALTVVGGEAAVSSSVAEQADRATGVTSRVAGASRYETARLAAEAALAEAGSMDTTWFATGRTYPDALVAGPAVAAAGGVLLLLDGSEYEDDSEAQRFLRAHRDQTHQLVLLGGAAALESGSRVGLRLAAGMCDQIDFPDDVRVALGAGFAGPPQHEGGERAILCNATDSPLDVGGWTIRNLDDEQVTIPDGVVIAPHRATDVFIGTGDNRSETVFLGRTEEFMADGYGGIETFDRSGASGGSRVDWKTCFTDDC